MHHCNRRTFALRVIAGGSVLGAAAGPGFAASTDPVSETDPYARSMGFRLETSQVDKVKYPRHDVSQHCSECQLYSGKAGEPLGPCSFYGGRLVPTNGWCRNFKVRKAKT